MSARKQLQPLRSRLSQLRRRRVRFRWNTAASAMATSVLVALAGIFLLDWSFQQNIDFWQRIILMLLAVGGIIWAARRFALPWLGQKEDLSDMALLVQKQSGIDSDLIAAMQFESPGAAQWGSRQLETAVIDRVASHQKELDVMASLPREPLESRLKFFGAVVVAWLLLCVFAPQYVVVFFHRLAFSNEHYPSRTQIAGLKINGHDVTLDSSGAATVHVGCGQPVNFEVTLAGKSQPLAGRAEVMTGQRAAPAIVPLEGAQASTDDDAPKVTILKGQFARLDQAATCKFFAGDAWTEPVALSVTPLPVVEVEAEVVPPAYARQSVDEVHRLARGIRQFTVVAGSLVRLKLHSDRPLASGKLKLGDQVVTLVRAPGAASGEEVWQPALDNNSLASIAKDSPFAIQVVDIEGQSPGPLDGFITIESDLPPRVAAATRTTTVLPTASPKIAYGAADDHALSAIWYTWEITAGTADSGIRESVAGDGMGLGIRPDKATSSPSASPNPQSLIPNTSPRSGKVELSKFGPEKYPKLVEQTCNLDLLSLHLVPGDTLKVTFHASDYRGPADPATADADPLVFQVTDLQGFEASMFDADQKSANILETMRKNLSGLGETK